MGELPDVTGDVIPQRRFLKKNFFVCFSWYAYFIKQFKVNITKSFFMKDKTVRKRVSTWSKEVEFGSILEL